LILFCDTSALVKLYIAETHSEALLQSAREANLLAVGRIAWAEAFAALSRRAREVPADASAIDEAKRRLGAQWREYFVLEISQAVVELAGDYADTFALRGYDSVQLACARTLQLATPEPVRFACFDARLLKAARVLGMEVFPEVQAEARR